MNNFENNVYIWKFDTTRYFKFLQCLSNKYAGKFKLSYFISYTSYSVNMEVFAIKIHYVHSCEYIEDIAVFRNCTESDRSVNTS